MKSKNGAYNHVLRYTGLFGGIQGFIMLMSFVRNKFAAIFIGSIGIGLIDVFNRTTGLFSSCFSLINPIAVTRSLSVDFENPDTNIFAERVRVIRSWTTLTSILSLITSLLLSPVLSLITFGDLSKMYSFMGISPIIPCLVISGTELSILRACRELRRLALASFWGALILPLVTIPFYIFVGINGVVPALSISTFLIMVINLAYSLPLYSWKSNPFSIATLRKGLDLVKLSLYYFFAGIVASLAEFALRSFMLNEGSVNDVGLYSAGFIVTVAAARFLFVAIDADFFPRLSGYSSSNRKMNLTVNRQLEVCVLLITPFLVFFNIFMPYIVRLLYASNFMAIVPMVVTAGFYMFFKSINTPIAYIPLAKGKGNMYLLMESLYYVYFLLLMMVGFYWKGIIGSGISLSLANFVEFILLCLVYNHYYDFKFSHKAIQIIIVQGIVLLLGIMVALYFDATLKYAIGLPLGILSLVYSLYTLSRRSSLKTILLRKN